MARKPIKQIDIQTPLELLTSQKDAKNRITDRIDKGRDILNAEIRTTDQFDLIKKEYSKWSDFNKEMLRRLFSNESLSLEYSRFHGVMSIGFGRIKSVGEEIKDFRDEVNKKVNKLESIIERLELYPSSIENQASIPDKIEHLSTNKAFIVHGHDDGALETTARFLDKLGINPVILHEQANGGRTVIEKLVHYSDVDFAVVLLTPDDFGGVVTAKDVINPRARQNVMLELGYFVGKLGRNRVCALHKGSVELPSDFLGVVYVEIDKADAWRLLLARELREAGFDINLNEAL